MDFLPLAELCNCVLSALNQIRLATPLALCLEMTERHGGNLLNLAP